MVRNVWKVPMRIAETAAKTNCSRRTAISSCAFFAEDVSRNLDAVLDAILRTLCSRRKVLIAKHRSRPGNVKNCRSLAAWLRNRAELEEHR